jgi:hypothetical protein
MMTVAEAKDMIAKASIDNADLIDYYRHRDNMRRVMGY